MSMYSDNQYNPWAIARAMQKKHGWSSAKTERAILKIKKRLGYRKTASGSYVVVRGKRVWLTGKKAAKPSARRYRSNGLVAIAASDNHAEVERVLACLKQAGFDATCKEDRSGRLLIQVASDCARDASAALNSRKFKSNPLMMVVTNPGYESNPVDIQYDPKSKSYEVIRFNENGPQPLTECTQIKVRGFCDNPSHASGFG